jgi:hypothetical protein
MMFGIAIKACVILNNMINLVLRRRSAKVGQPRVSMVQRRAARYVQNNCHNTSSVTSMIDTLGWPTLAERRLKTRLIMLFKITSCIQVLASLVLDMPEILLQGLISVNFFLSIREIYFHLK